MRARSSRRSATTAAIRSIASARSKTERSAQPRHAALAAAIARSASSRVPSGRVPRLSPVAGLVASRRAPDSLSTHSPAMYMPCSTARVSHQPIIRARTPYGRQRVHSPSDARWEAGGAVAPVRLSSSAEQEEERDADREDDQTGDKGCQAPGPTAADRRIRRPVLRRKVRRGRRGGLAHDASAPGAPSPRGQAGGSPCRPSSSPRPTGRARAGGTWCAAPSAGCRRSSPTAGA